MFANIPENALTGHFLNSLTRITGLKRVPHPFLAVLCPTYMYVSKYCLFKSLAKIILFLKELCLTF